MSIQLNNDQIDFICSLYETDEYFRNIVNEKIEQKVSQVKKELESLSAIKSSFTPVEKKPQQSHSKKNTMNASKKNYRNEILDILQNNPGITVKDIHTEMKKSHADLDRHVLATTVYDMKTKNYLKSEGVKPNMKYYTL